jgi:hypothetical protein
MVCESKSFGDSSAGKIVKNLDLAYNQAMKMAARDPGAIAALEIQFELVERRLRAKFDKERDLEFQSMMERIKFKPQIFSAVRWGIRVSTVAGVSTAIVLTKGVTGPAVALVPLVENGAQVWSRYERGRREEAIASYKAFYDKNLANYYGKEELEDEGIANIKRLFSHDILDKS